MPQTAAVHATPAEPEVGEAIPTASGLIQPILVEELGAVPSGLQTAAKRANMTLLDAHSVSVPGVQLAVPDTKAFIEAAKSLGAKRLYTWVEPLHARASAEVHLSHIEDALEEMESDSDDPEEQEAQAELTSELQRAKEVFTANGALVYGAGFLADGVMHQVFITENGLVDALLILSALLEVSGGREDDDDDDELHELDTDEAAKLIIEHVEDEMEVPPRDMKRRANELARQAAHQLTDGDELNPAQKQRVQQAIKLAAVRMRKG